MSTCKGQPQIGWFRDGTVHAWCSDCDAEVVLRVELPAGIEWIDVPGGARYPLIRNEIRQAIERAIARRYLARFVDHEPVEKPAPRIRWPSAA